VDPFAGAGTIPLESALQGRRAFGADISPYAKILSLAKLFPPRSLNDALKKAEDALAEADFYPSPTCELFLSGSGNFFIQKLCVKRSISP